MSPVAPGSGVEAYPSVQTSESTSTGVQKYMYNKIRILLGAIQRKKGWPARAHHSVGFYGLQMFAVPDFTTIDREHTMKAWKGSRSKEYEWRKVRIFDIPTLDMVELANVVPMQYGSLVLNKTMRINTIRDWPMYENLLSKGGISNIMIDHNWDKIKKELELNGY